MIVLAIDLLLMSAFLLAVGIRMAKGDVFFADGKLVCSLLMLSIVLPFPFYVLFSIDVSGFVAALSVILILLGLAIVLYPILRMPKALAVFNVGREKAAGIVRGVLEKHGIAFESNPPRPGAPVVMRPGFSFRPQRGWRFAIDGFPGIIEKTVADNSQLLLTSPKITRK